MSLLDIAAGVAFCVMLALIAGAEPLSRMLADLQDGLAGRDRRHHIKDCSAYGGKVSYDPAQGPSRRPSFYACEHALEAGCDCAEIERLRSGTALAEALFCQVSEIRLLPTVEPRRTLKP